MVLQELLDYEMMFALWLSISRVELRRAASMLTAIGSALGGVPKEMFEALAEDADQARAFHESYMADQRAAEAAARMRGEFMGLDGA